MYIDAIPLTLYEYAMGSTDMVIFQVHGNGTFHQVGLTYMVFIALIDFLIKTISKSKQIVNQTKVGQIICLQ